MNSTHNLWYCTKIVNISRERLRKCKNLYNTSFPQKYVWISFKTSAAAGDLQHLKVEVADQDFPNCSYVINRTCQHPMLIMKIKSIKNRENIKHKYLKII